MKSSSICLSSYLVLLVMATTTNNDEHKTTCMRMLSTTNRLTEHLKNESHIQGNGFSYVWAATSFFHNSTIERNDIPAYEMGGEEVASKSL